MAVQGYAGTSVTELCERADVVRPVLYSHFGSKEGLLAAVVEHVGNAIVDTLRSNFESHDPSIDGQERLNRVLATYRSFIVERPERLRLLLLITLERGESSPEVRSAMRRYQEYAVQSIVESVEEVVGMPLPDLDLLAVTVISVLQNALIRRVFDPDGDYLERLWDEVAQTVRSGVVHRIKRLQKQGSTPPPNA